MKLALIIAIRCSMSRRQFHPQKRSKKQSSSSNDELSDIANQEVTIIKLYESSKGIVSAASICICYSNIN